MKILIAPDKFKGSISALAAAEAVARGLRASLPGAQLRIAPIADGGEGFAETLSVALGGKWVATRARDPLGREVDARYAWVAGEKLAIIEMSEASGLWRVKPEERDPLRATTYGTGQLMRHAIARGARKILVGLGGSATTDGGMGMAQALGFEFVTESKQDQHYRWFAKSLLKPCRTFDQIAREENIVDSKNVQKQILELRGALGLRNPTGRPRKG